MGARGRGLCKRVAPLHTSGFEARDSGSSNEVERIGARFIPVFTMRLSNIGRSGPMDSPARCRRYFLCAVTLPLCVVLVNQCQCATLANCVHTSPELAVLLHTHSSPCTPQNGGGSRVPPTSPRNSHLCWLWRPAPRMLMCLPPFTGPLPAVGPPSGPPKFMSTRASECDLIWKQVKWGHPSLGTPNVIQLVSL